MPKTQSDYWSSKFAANVARDSAAAAALTALGWRVIVIWECESKEPGKLETTLRRVQDVV
jgi:DNA mismatch endonuclease (patch repair protein)